MPTRQEILETKLQEFNTKYNLHLTVTSFDIRSVPANRQNMKQAYKDLLLNTLTEYVSNAMKMRSNESYDFTGLSYADFAKEFDDVMQATYDWKRIPNRTAYEGNKLDELFDEMMERTRGYSYPLSTLWKNDLMNGGLTVESMKTITADASTVLLGPGADNPAFMSERAKNALTCLVAAKRAMEEVRENRPRRWRFFHPILNHREKKYLKALNKSVNTCQERGFPVQTVSSTLDNETLQDTFANLQEHEAYTQQAETRNANKQFAEDRLKKGVVDNVIHHYIPKQTSKEFEAKLAQDLVNVLPEGGTFKAVKIQRIQEKVRSFMDLANKLNFNYEETGKNLAPHGTMQGYAWQIFVATLDATDGLKYNFKGRLLAAQRMTDIIMNELSPAPLAKEALGQYADGYILKNPDSYITAVSCLGSFFANIITYFMGL